jgi:hypothetical protein
MRPSARLVRSETGRHRRWWTSAGGGGGGKIIATSTALQVSTPWTPGQRPLKVEYVDESSTRDIMMLIVFSLTTWMARSGSHGVLMLGVLQWRRLDRVMEVLFVGSR